MPDAVSNIEVIFDEDLSSFDSTNRLLTVPVTISWTPPEQLYGALQNYTVSVESSSGESVHLSPSVDAAMTLVSATVMVFPVEEYTATVNATTGGGTSSNSTTVTSPEAGRNSSDVVYTRGWHTPIHSVQAFSTCGFDP